MPAISHITPSPREITLSMLTSWHRNHQVTDVYANAARDVIDRVEILGTDKRNQFTMDYALVRALMRLDKEGIYLYQGVRNIQMGNGRLLDFVSHYDPEHAGELTVVKNAKKLQCKPEDVAMMITNVIVYTSCIYALCMHKEIEVRKYLAMMDTKNATHRTRVWLQEELQDYLAKNRKFSESGFDEEICRYLTKASRRTVIEKKERLW